MDQQCERKTSIRHGWPSGLRRQFKVLFSSGAWVRTPLHAFLAQEDVYRNENVFPFLYFIYFFCFIFFSFLPSPFIYFFFFFFYLFFLLFILFIFSFLFFFIFSIYFYLFVLYFLYKQDRLFSSLVGSYQVGYTRSHPNTEVKMLRAC